MVNDLNIDYDENDLEILERDIQSSVRSMQRSGESASGLKSV